MRKQSEKMTNKELITFYKRIIKKNESNEESFILKRLDVLVKKENNKNNKYIKAGKRLAYQRMWRKRKRSEGC